MLRPGSPRCPLANDRAWCKVSGDWPPLGCLKGKEAQLLVGPWTQLLDSLNVTSFKM